MTEYNLKGTYEPGSLDEVVGEVNAIVRRAPSQNKNVIDYSLDRVPLPILVAGAGVFGSIAVMEIYSIFSVLSGVIR